ncbi:MAG: HD domain-containing protein [Candidatus Electryonea clarkiae]|nr:HD domain-containing protein [Candidatus Electryonea clarkiae]MDP8287396.1 HD domain-containing protein [Candidatus Electryonea clarkiae]
MRIKSTSKLEEGEVLGKSVFNERSELMLSSGYVLTEAMISLLKHKGFNYVYIMDGISKDIIPEEVISDVIRQATNSKIAKTFEGVKNNLAFEKFAPEEIKKRLVEDAEMHNIVKMTDVREQVEQMLEEIIDNNLTMFTSLPMKSESGADYEHAFDTSVLSILMAQEFKYDQHEMKTIGSSAMVHDIGKMAFGDMAEKKESDLSRDEKMLLREHPVYSMLILQGSEPDAFVEHTTVFQHHEQVNGKGYPQGLKGINKPPTKSRGNDKRYIYRMAEIIAVANVYDNLTSGALDGTIRTPEDAIVEIINGETGEWNQSVIKKLTKVVQCYPVGSTVRIKNNISNKYIDYRGIITKANPKDQSRPTILLTNNSLGAPIMPRLVDFKDEKEMSIRLEL